MTTGEFSTGAATQEPEQPVTRSGDRRAQAEAPSDTELRLSALGMAVQLHHARITSGHQVGDSVLGIAEAFHKFLAGKP